MVSNIDLSSTCETGLHHPSTNPSSTVLQFEVKESSSSCWRNYRAELSQNALQYLQTYPPQEVVLESHFSIPILSIFWFLIKLWKVQFMSIKRVIPSIAACCCCCLGVLHCSPLPLKSRHISDPPAVPRSPTATRAPSVPVPVLGN